MLLPSRLQIIPDGSVVGWLEELAQQDHEPGSQIAIALMYGMYHNGKGFLSFVTMAAEKNYVRLKNSGGRPDPADRTLQADIAYLHGQS